MRADVLTAAYNAAMAGGVTGLVLGWGGQPCEPLLLHSNCSRFTRTHRDTICSQQHRVLLMCCETRQLCFPGGPAAALQSAAGFAAFSFVMDKFQVAQEAEAAAHPGNTAQVLDPMDIASDACCKRQLHV